MNGKSNQLPKTEGCLAEEEPVDLLYFRVGRPSRSVPRERREPQAGPASCLSNSASKEQVASGDGVCLPEPKTERSATGEDLEGRPGSESVARAEGGARNRGGPESPCRTNCEGQAGREAQRQEAPPDAPGVGLAHSISRQGVSPEAGEGADRSTQSALAVRHNEHGRRGGRFLFSHQRRVIDCLPSAGSLAERRLVAVSCLKGTGLPLDSTARGGFSVQATSSPPSRKVTE